MRHSSKPVLLASQLPAHLLSLSRDGSQPMVDCLEGCGQSIIIHRHVVKAHKLADGTWCLGSGQRLRVDLTFEQWRQRLRDIERTANFRRPSPSRRQPQPPTPTPVHRIRRPAA
jgi:hypothetical protein